ncbi:hypothetical protein Tco_0078644 [Tanacetum coccineum]
MGLPEVAPATKSILDELLDEFGNEILNVAMANDEADFNPTKDLEELERLLAEEPQSNFTKIQGCNSEKTIFLAIQVLHKWWYLDTRQAVRKHSKPD